MPFSCTLWYFRPKAPNLALCFQVGYQVHEHHFLSFLNSVFEPMLNGCSNHDLLSDVLMTANDFWNPSSAINILIVCSCFTTEILEGFDVQRTANLTETLRKYGYLTEAIFKYYKELPEEQCKHAGVCPTFDKFNKRCQDLDKMTISDVFAIQLMQVTVLRERKSYCT